MAYETGSSTGPHDILDKIRSFALADGWTINRYDTSPAGDSARNELCLSKGTAYFNLASFQGSSDVIINGGVSPNSNNYFGVVMNGSDGYSGGSPWDQQVGHPEYPAVTTNRQRHVHIFGAGGYPTYHLFSPNANCIYLEVEVEPSIYQRLGFGSLDNFGSPAGDGRFFYATTNSSADSFTTSYYNNGTDSPNFSFEMVPFRSAYFTGSPTDLNSASFVRAAFDSFDGWAQTGRSPSATFTGAAAQGGVHEIIIRETSPSPLNGLGVLTPVIVSYNANDEFLMPIGVLPGIRYMDMSLYQPAEEFSLGSDTWKVFPWWQKGGNSRQRAIAYLRVD